MKKPVLTVRGSYPDPDLQHPILTHTFTQTHTQSDTHTQLQTLTEAHTEVWTPLQHLSGQQACKQTQCNRHTGGCICTTHTYVHSVTDT